MTKKETKLNATLRRHLLSIAKGFANDQKINSNRQRDVRISRAKDKYIEEHSTKELNKLFKQWSQLKLDLKSKEDELDQACNATGLRFCSSGFYIAYDKENEIVRKVDLNSDVQWDVILSTVALKLELCNTYEEAKDLIEQVTGANVDSMITTIIPPNLQLTNNNN